MPINVQHGVPASPGLAGLAQTAMQIEAARQARLSGGGGGGSRGGGGGSNLAQQQYDLAAQQDYYNKRAAQQDYQQESQLMNQGAQLDQDQFEYEYTAKQRMQVSQWTNALSDLPNDASLSNDERETMAFQLKQRIAGIEKTAKLADTNKPSWAGTEQDVGQTWSNESGGISTRKANGDVVEMTEFSETERGIERAAKTKREEDQRKFVLELLTEDIKYLDKGIEKTKKREPADVFAIIAEGQEVMDLLEQAEQERQNRAEQPPPSSIPIEEEQESPSGYVGLARSLGITPNEKELNIGGDIGAMFAILRTVETQYTDKDGKLDLSNAPSELIENLELMEQRAASWLANAELDRSQRKPIPTKKKQGRRSYSTSFGSQVLGQF